MPFYQAILLFAMFYAQPPMAGGGTGAAMGCLMTDDLFPLHSSSWANGCDVGLVDSYSLGEGCIWLAAGIDICQQQFSC